MSKRFLAIVECDSSIQCQLLYNQLPRLKPLFDDIIVISNSENNFLFDELPSFDNVVTGYLENKQDWDMWLCGFHYGRCIHIKIDEVIEKYDWDNSRFHIIQNLSFMFPKDTKSRLQTWDRSCSMIDIKEYNWDYEERLTEL